MIFSLFRKDPRRVLIAAFYKRIATASREPGLYAALGIPDSLEGRFESLTLHMVLVLRALRHLPAPADEVAKDVTDAFFRDLDASLREMGIGDTTVPKRMKKLAEAFFGRAHAYDKPLDAEDETGLALALGRNVCASGEPALGLARYVQAADRALRGLALDEILERELTLPQPNAFA